MTLGYNRAQVTHSSKHRLLATIEQQNANHKFIIISYLQSLMRHGAFVNGLSKDNDLISIFSLFNFYLEISTALSGQKFKIVTAPLRKNSELSFKPIINDSLVFFLKKRKR